MDGLKRYLVLFVIELKTRCVHVAGIHRQPNGEWMEQVARNLTDPGDGFLRASRHLIHDRAQDGRSLCHVHAGRGVTTLHGGSTEQEGATGVRLFYGARLRQERL